MTGQLDLFEHCVARPEVDPNGSVTKHPKVTHRLSAPKNAMPIAVIQLHPHCDGRWMWGVSYTLSHRGSGYQVGPKWGRFATSETEAKCCAIDELIRGIDGAICDQSRKIREWTAAGCPR